MRSNNEDEILVGSRITDEGLQILISTPVRMASSLLTSTACATPTTRSNRQKRASYAAATPSTGTRRFFPVIPTHLAEAGVATHISGPHGNASIAAIWNRTNAGP